MSNTTSPARRRMRAPIVAVATIALAASLLAACQPTDGAVGALVPTGQSSDTGGHMSMPAGVRTASENALYQGMQTLWQQHMEWTYATIAAFATDSPGYPATVDRLLKNQVDIGNAVKPFYGRAAGDSLTVLLKAHIAGVAAILTAAKADDAAAQTEAVAAEYANARAIGDLLATANPANWSRARMEKMMETHIDQTLVYATDLLLGRYNRGIAHYGAAESHMVQMGNMLSAGLISQFPARFTT